MFGKLTLEAIPTDEPIIMWTLAVVALIALAGIAAITYYRKWAYLWNEWFTSVDHKRIGVMYIVVGLVMLLRGFSDAIMMRTQQAMASDGSPGYLPPEHYDQIFTAHGVIMIFFMAMPLVVGLMNIVVPLQIGARDVAFPFLNALSFWLFVAGAMLVNVSLAVGEFARTGWVAYPPLSGLSYSPGVGVDYYIWSLQISGVGTLLTGVNFFVTILKMRTPGMTLFRMPVFTWTVLCTAVLILASFPILTATLFMLSLDRYLDMHFFTNELGGNPMMYVNLIWAGPPGGVHPDPAGVRHLFRGGVDLQPQAPVRLSLAGVGDDRHHHPVVHRLGAPLLHHGLGGERQRILRHHDHDHRRAHRGENLHLAVHHVPRAGAL
jgi:cytochrome o ubiquinol oxidase subunit 1